MLNIYNIIKKPMVTERTNILKEQQNKYFFVVNPLATKGQIKQAIETIFKVKVKKINTSVYLGKKRRMGRYEGYRSDWKKAIVQLVKGQEIKMFEEKA